MYEFSKYIPDSEPTNSLNYTSPFERIIKLSPSGENPFGQSGERNFFSDARKFQECEAPLSDIFSELFKVLQSSELTYEELMTLAFHAPRILRAVINFLVDKNLKSEEILLEMAVNVALKIYKNDTASINELNELQLYIQKYYPDLLRLTVIQKYDRFELIALDPELSRKTANEIKSFTRSNDIIFIALAHGGVQSGLDVFLRYLDLSKSQDSIFLPIRFSRRKLKESTPQITLSQAEIIHSRQKDTPIIIFDSDSSSSHISQTRNTLEDSAIFFSQEIAPLSQMLILSNYGPNPEEVNLCYYRQSDIWYAKIQSLEAFERAVSNENLNQSQINILKKIVNSNEDNRVIEIAKRILTNVHYINEV